MHNKGILYGVSVGPGDPELLTLKAVRVLKACSVIATPQTAGEKTLALDIAAAAVDLSEKTIVTLPFLMTRDKAALAENHRAQAETVKAFLEEGKDVAMLNLGDVSIYSTFAYLMENLVAQHYEVKMIAGVTSFCAVAAALGTGLTAMNQPLHIVPASGMPLGETLAMSGTKVLMKSGSQMPAVLQTLIETGLADKTMLVQNCGLPNEKICRDIRTMSPDASYFTTVIVKE